MKLYAIEGNRQHLDGGAMFGNAPKAMWSKWFESDSENRIPLACRALLVQTDNGKNVLFEAGIGAFFEPELKKRFGVVPEEHLLLKNLGHIGLKEEAIDQIVLSHLHFDHAGGLLSAWGENPLRLHFPNARYYVAKRHWEYANNPHPREKASFIPVLHELLKASGRLVLIEEARHADFDFEVKFHFSDGHTKGLMISEVQMESGPLIFASDLIPGNPWIHLPLAMGYDRFPELKIDEKKELYESLASSHAKLFFTHDPTVVAADLMRDDKGKYFGKPRELWHD